MPTNLAIDDDLLNEALRLSRLRTKRETVNEALRGYISYLRRLQMVRGFGTIDFDPTYDHKRERKRR